MSGPAIWDQTHLIPLFVLSAVENRGLRQVMFLTKTEVSSRLGVLSCDSGCQYRDKNGGRC